MKSFKFFKKKHSESEIQIFDFLRKAEMLETLTDDELSYFLPYLYLRDYKKNEVVFFTGDPSYALYMVKKGIITLNLDIKDSFEKLMTLRSGRLFGDNALLPNSKRIYSAIVETEQASIYVLPKENLLEILNAHPLIKAKIMTAFAEAYNKYTTRLFATYKSSLGFFDLTTVYSGA
ncbi:MAG: cyclic nucleotide-binding domain-containing protein [Cyclobacteriaceae bacterium]